MPIVATDLQFFKSTASGPSSGGGTAQSLGGAITATQLVDGLLNDLYDNILAAESAIGATDYRCIYFQNKNATLVYQGAILFISANAPNPNVNCQIGLDPVGLNGVATTIADEFTAPVGVTFSEPGIGSPFLLGDMDPDDFYPLWIARTVTAGASASTADSCTLAVAGASDP